MRMLVTGATGLVGANTCRIARDRGDSVCGLVRDAEAARGLAGLGVQLHTGDVTDPGSLTAAMDGVDVVVHTAALLGGATQDIRRHEAVNTFGTRNVVESARQAGVERTVVLTSHVIYDHSITLTERPRFPDVLTDTAYASAKRMAFLDCERRVGAGQDIVFVVPGGVYGPSPLVERALDRTSVNNHFVRALAGDVQSWVRWSVAFVYVDDVVDVVLRGLEAGTAGETFIAMGRSADVRTLGGCSRRVRALAGVDAPVIEVDAGDIEPGSEAQYGGPSLVRLAARGAPDPLFDDSHTRRRLGNEPRAFDDGAHRTIDWLRAVGR